MGRRQVGNQLLAVCSQKKLNCYYIYSGLLYRALAHVLMTQYGYTLAMLPDAKPEDVLAVLDLKRFKYCFDDGEKVIFDSINITPYLKEAVIDQAASIVSTNKNVRVSIDEMQRTIAADHKSVIDGRDAGTVVFPNAHYKFFLTADPTIRAQRWQAHQAQRGNSISLDEAIQFLAIRDKRDSTREHAPLKKAGDGIEIDNSRMNLKQTLETILNRIQ